jgi:hypothetical protein
MPGTKQPLNRTRARVCFNEEDRVWPVLWIDEERFALARPTIAQGASVAARFTFAQAFTLTIPARAEIPTSRGQTFQLTDMPPALLRMFRVVAGLPQQQEQQQ